MAVAGRDRMYKFASIAILLSISGCQNSDRHMSSEHTKNVLSTLGKSIEGAIHKGLISRDEIDRYDGHSLVVFLHSHGFFGMLDDDEFWKDAWGNSLRFCFVSDNIYEICSAGPDGQFDAKSDSDDLRILVPLGDAVR